MINFFQGAAQIIYAVESDQSFTSETILKLNWLFAGSYMKNVNNLKGYFLGPRKEMVTPWSTNAVEITMNMGIKGITRIESFEKVDNPDLEFDAMLQFLYEGLDQELYSIYHDPDPVIEIDDIASYNKEEGLALSSEEIDYLNGVSEKLGRKLTDSEVFGFSQVNSEHCRHKIFNGQFIIDGQEMADSLFTLIKKTSKANPDNLVSAYKDNVAFIKGPVIEQFAPERQDIPDYFATKDIDSVISLKAETHNFPTTVEPFNGASTGTGGEIRDRMAGGKGSIPMAGTAVYMTSYSRLEKDRLWEKQITERPWLYQTPIDILIKASNGASDFGNKFGQPLICGSLLTFEHSEHGKDFGYDKVIMLAGGIGYGKKRDSLKDIPNQQDRIIMMGGDNYRIGMGGGAVSSVATGEYGNQIELNAVQRANPEMQKRVYNAIRALSELDNNPIVSLHDHGAGGHLNCFSELVEETGGVVELDNLPIGDPTLSSKEIIGNESQERMGMILKEKDIKLLKDISNRERAPMFDVGKSTGDHQLTFKTTKNNSKPIDWKVEHMFGNPPKTIIKDSSVQQKFNAIDYDAGKIKEYIEQLLQIEAVACKDWLTNKVDRSVTGKIAHQQTCGPLQLPLNNLGAVALDYKGKGGVATSIGHAPVSGLLDPAKGSVLSIVEALTNIIWAPLNNGLQNVSLSANWMWPCKNAGEDARLYKAVKAVSEFAIQLGINVPTGKDSLSMTQKYPDGKVVYSPGTVIISAAAEITDIRKIVSTDALNVPGSDLYYVSIGEEDFKLGGSSFAQLLNKIGPDVPGDIDADYFKKVFNAIQELVNDQHILAGHDVSAGGMITTLLELVFPCNNMAFEIDLSNFSEEDTIKILFSEKPGLVIQVQDNKQVEDVFKNSGVKYLRLGKIVSGSQAIIRHESKKHQLDVVKLRDLWFKTSFLLDQQQTVPKLAAERFSNYKKHELNFKFPDNFNGKLASLGLDINRSKKTGIKAAIIREKGVNGDREMAYSMHLAGFDVKDVHMTDLISGRETLDEVNFIVFVGGFSNSDVLGSAKGWAGAFLFNQKAKAALEKFYDRPDTLSLGVCNGCQLMVELGLIYPDLDNKPQMLHNKSGKFESSFLMIDVLPNNSVMLKSLAGSSLGIWVAHGEGRFHLELPEENYNIPAKYSYSSYPANPNSSDYDAACITSNNGRHLAIMPHLERAIFPWQWGYYPHERNSDEISPWLEAFANAKQWIIDYQEDGKS
jgi:phosphoribosylformylglycinamidine synthase